MSNMNPVVHFEMPYEDRDRAADFYSKTFGWNAQKFGAEMGNYMLVQTDVTDDKGMIKEAGRINGGLYEKGQGGGTSTHVVISVDNIKEHMEKVKAGGGMVDGEPMDIPGIGTFVMIKDTEGNRVGMLQPVPMG